METEEHGDQNEMEFLGPNDRITDFNADRTPLHQVPRASSKHRTASRTSINTPRESLSQTRSARHTMGMQNKNNQGVHPASYQPSPLKNALIGQV